MQTGAEHRRHHRFALSLPVEVKAGPGVQVETATRDVSASGLYFSMPQNVQPGSELDWELMLPPELCGGEKVRIRCHGKVVRVERPDAQGKIGVAATIESYRFIKAD